MMFKFIAKHRIILYNLYNNFKAVESCGKEGNMNNLTFHKLSYGVYVVSTLDENRFTGCVANSAMQITSSPATIAVSINHDNYTNRCVSKHKVFALNILSEKTDPAIIGTFGFKSGRDVNKFEKVEFEEKNGLPVLKEACAYLICRVIDNMETATHTVFLCQVEDGDILDSNEPMTYAYYHKVVKGTAPKNAPTYIPEKAKQEEILIRREDGRWVCPVCGYVYDGDVPFEELSESWVCPICLQPKSEFVKK